MYIYVYVYIYIFKQCICKLRKHIKHYFRQRKSDSVGRVSGHSMHSYRFLLFLMTFDSYFDSHKAKNIEPLSGKKGRTR